MQVKEVFKASGRISCNDDLSDRRLEEFFTKIEDVMNEYKVYRIRDILLNPFEKGVKIKK